MKNFFAGVLLAVSTLTIVPAASVSAQENAATAAPAVQGAPVEQQAAAAPAPVVAAPSAPADSGIGIILLGLGLVGVAGLFVYRMAKNKDTPANSAFAPAKQPDFAAAVPPAPVQPVPAPAYVPVVPPVPADFDSAAFLQHAKTSFIRMQAAWDKADTNDLQEFTTPAVFAELKAQIEQRGHTGDVTEVVSIDSELLGVETMDSDYLASVKFLGMIKPAPAAPAEPFAEVWNMSKPRDGSAGWVLAGIQQLS